MIRLVRVSCATKFHAFALAEQLERFGMLDRFYTLFFSKKNTLLKNFHHRTDKEKISVTRVTTFPIFTPIFFKWKDLHSRAEAYDKMVAGQLRKNKNYKIFIGWSSMSLHSMQQAGKDGKLLILERGSSHIVYQDMILKEEYSKFGIDFSIDNRVIEKELLEYELADFISIPSRFVYDSFIKQGIPEQKLVINNYGTSSIFKIIPQEKNIRPFRILYLGGVTIRKGLIYLFQSVKLLYDKLPKGAFEFWLIGSIADEMKETIIQYQNDSWRIFGHINHYQLPEYISQCDVAVHPSLEEGLSMVIPQIMSCGIPVIASTNTGGGDLIENGVNGFIVAIRDYKAIAEKIELLFSQSHLLEEMKINTEMLSKENFSWDKYGERYTDFLNTII